MTRLRLSSARFDFGQYDTKWVVFDLEASPVEVELTKPKNSPLPKFDPDPWPLLLISREQLRDTCMACAKRRKGTGMS